jgi:putative membrane protein
MTPLMRWRRRQARGQPLDTRAAPVIARISAVQALQIVAMVFAASAMARGLVQNQATFLGISSGH